MADDIKCILENQNSPEEEWHQLTEADKLKILQSLEQADAGLGITLAKCNEKLREKYGLT